MGDGAITGQIGIGGYSGRNTKERKRDLRSGFTRRRAQNGAKTLIEPLRETLRVAFCGMA